MSIFIKHPHQFIYSTHLFNKTFIILLIFIIHSLTVPLSHRPTATITTQPPSPPSSETKEKSDQPTHTDQPTYQLTHTKNQIQHQINQHRSTHTKKNQRRSKRHRLHASTPPRLHTYLDQPTTQISPDQANPHKPRPTHTINSD